MTNARIDGASHLNLLCTGQIKKDVADSDVHFLLIVTVDCGNIGRRTFEEKPIVHSRLSMVG